jgi:hypothetical protein
VPVKSSENTFEAKTAQIRPPAPRQRDLNTKQPQGGFFQLPCLYARSDLRIVLASMHGSAAVLSNRYAMNRFKAIKP